MTLRADVVVYGAGSADECDMAVEAFADVDVAARVESVGSGAGGQSQLLLASVSIRLLYEQLAAERRGGRTVAGTIAGVAERLCGAAGGTAGSRSKLVVLQDTETGIQVFVAPGLPEEAFARLGELDLAQYTFGPLHYDDSAGRWRSVMDEWASA